MSYVVLARKWRPRTFADLVGQEHVSRTIANAIAAERVAHAFLFTGVRGVGKTTSARILAKSLNCLNGPTDTPCLACGPCTDIENGSDVDVQEIDGASHTGIDDVRRLQETLPYRPARDRFKILIVDEVHMLTKPAWNAFLKTLEEPPPHVKFIFATTEADKVPTTILSRCQRYDFKLIETVEIAQRLQHVLTEEGVQSDPEGINIIAKEAAGSMRDAMSLLDQVIAWVGQGEEVLSADVVSRVLGVAKRSLQHAIAEAVVDGDASRCLDLVQELAGQGFGIPAVARDFLAYLRDLVVAKVSREPATLLKLADQELSSLVSLAERSQQDDLSRLYLAFSRSFDDVVRSSQPRSALEMTLVRMAGRPPLVPVDELLRRLAALEARIAAGGGGSGGGEGAGPSGQGGQRRPPAGGGGTSGPSSGASTAPANRSASTASPAASTASGPVQGGAGSPNRRTRPSQANHSPQRPRQADGAAFSKSSAKPVEARPQSAPAVTKAPPQPVSDSGHRDARKKVVDSSAVGPPKPIAPGEKAVLADATASQVLPAIELEPAATTNFAKPLTESTLGVLRQLLKRLAAKRAGVASMFEHASPLAVDQEKVIFAFAPDSFLLQQVHEAGGVELMAAAVVEQFGSATQFEVVSDGRHEQVQTVAAFDAAARAAAIEEARRRVIEHPLVKAAVSELGAELRDVRLPNG